MMEWFEGMLGPILNPPTLDERIRENRKKLARAIQDLSYERRQLQAADGRIKEEVQALATKGRVKAAKTRVRTMVRNRKAVDRFYEIESQLQAIDIQIQTVRSAASLTGAMRDATMAMGALNQTVNTAALAAIMRRFEVENRMMENKQSRMDATINNVFSSDEADQEEEELMNEIWDEIGVDLSADLSGHPPRRTVEGKGPSSRETTQKQIAVQSDGDGDDSDSSSGEGGDGDDDSHNNNQNIEDRVKSLHRF